MENLPCLSLFLRFSVSLCYALIFSGRRGVDDALEPGQRAIGFFVQTDDGVGQDTIAVGVLRATIFMRAIAINFQRKLQCPMRRVLVIAIEDAEIVMDGFFAGAEVAIG